MEACHVSFSNDRFGILWESDNFDFFDCRVFWRWLPCANVWPTDAVSQITFVCMNFFIDLFFFLFWKSTENKLQSYYFNLQWCSFMNDSNGKRFFFKDLNDCCSNFCIKTSCYLFLIYLCGQFCYTSVFDVIFLPNRRYLNLWLIWHQIWFHTSYEHIFITVNDIWFSFIK